MTRRWQFGVAVITAVLVSGITAYAATRDDENRAERAAGGLAEGFEPAVVRAQHELGRYFISVDGPSVAQAAPNAPAPVQKSAAADARASQQGVVGAVKALGGDVVYRFDTLVNALSADLTAADAADIAERPDVNAVEPVRIVQKTNESSVPFIGATDVQEDLGVQGQGMRVSVVDDGIDYTHANYGGEGTVEAFEANNPNFIEPGSFPTTKVIGGYDFVGSNYDLLDDDPTNDVPREDPDPLNDDGGHGSHTSGTVAGIGVDGEIGPGVAPKAKLFAMKVWDEGNSTDDVLVAAYERSMDPNNDGNTSDAVDVLSFSGGVDYGTESSTEAQAAQKVVNMGTVFVASAGNSGNQPIGASAYITGTPANAPGVISVAASIDEFNAQNLTVDDPATELPDGGLMVTQEWGPPLPDGGITDQIIDAREFDEPADPENPVATDQMLCDPVGGTPFAGSIALIFKASSGAGDCFADDKVVNAQDAGAEAVVLWNGFGGLPSQIGIGGNGSNIEVPVVMISTPDSETLADVISPDAANSNFNTVATTVTLHDEETVFPQFTDAMTDFTSEGPARVSSALKPDVSAPGFDIQSTGNGTGDQGVKLSGTSMSAPHISGVATLLRQLHPNFKPARIKALIMNHAEQDLQDNTLGSPVSATVMGSGRVQADESAEAVSVAEPGSLSFGLRPTAGEFTRIQQITVRNFDKKKHTYEVSGGEPRYSDFDPSVADVSVSPSSFNLAAGAKRKVDVELTLDPSAITEADQQNGWYYVLGNVDGNVEIQQSKNGSDEFHVPWHVTPLATSDNSFSESSLDLTGGSDTMELVEGPAAGTSYADLYQLGALDSDNSKGEEDVLAMGARSFTGNDLEDEAAEGVPEGTDEFFGITWPEFLTNGDEPVEPIEFGVQTYGVHNVTETLEVDVLVDAGADGVYAGTPLDIPADYLVVKLAAPSSTAGEVCVFDLSLPGPFAECAASYFADYSNYNSNLVGLVVNAGDIGLDNSESEFAYQVTACTGSFSGDDPGFFCDDAFGPADDGYTEPIDAANPPLAVDPQVCKGFWDGGACDNANPVTVDVGSAEPDSDPSLLALFPNNAPSHDPVVIETDN